MPTSASRFEDALSEEAAPTPVHHTREVRMPAMVSEKTGVALGLVIVLITSLLGAVAYAATLKGQIDLLQMGQAQLAKEITALSLAIKNPAPDPDKLTWPEMYEWVDALREANPNIKIPSLTRRK